MDGTLGDGKVRGDRGQSQTDAVANVSLGFSVAVLCLVFSDLIENNLLIPFFLQAV